MLALQHRDGLLPPDELTTPQTDTHRQGLHGSPPCSPGTPIWRSSRPWGVYQTMVAACRDRDWTKRQDQMQHLIDTLSTAVPAALVEIRTLGRTLKNRAADILAYFDRPGTSDRPTEAIKGKPNHFILENWSRSLILRSPVFPA